MRVLLSMYGSQRDVETMAALAQFDAIAAAVAKFDAPLARVMANGMRQ